VGLVLLSAGYRPGYLGLAYILTVQRLGNKAEIKKKRNDTREGECGKKRQGRRIQRFLLAHKVKFRQKWLSSISPEDSESCRFLIMAKTD